MTTTAQDPSSFYVKGQVARLLLENANSDNNGQNRLSQRDMAIRLGTNWISIHDSLKSLYNEGIIRIERNRIILNRDLIQKATAETF